MADSNKKTLDTMFLSRLFFSFPFLFRSQGVIHDHCYRGCKPKRRGGQDHHRRLPGAWPTVPLNAETCKALQDWLAVRSGAGNHVWTQVEGKFFDGLSSRSVQRVLARIGQDADLEHLTPHVLRHTFAKNLVDGGGLEKVAALLGHSNLNTTRIYITPNQKDLEQVVERLSGNN